MKPCLVFLSRRAEKQLRTVPARIRDKVEVWASDIEECGIRNVRKIKGRHDEPLRGKRKGQRSVRLNRSYRLI